MLDYARQRLKEALGIPRRAVLATSGPAGLLASEFPCQAVGLQLYLLVPLTSDHLFNLEHDSRVTVLAPGWEMRGIAYVIPIESIDLQIDLAWDPCTRWCALVRIDPCSLQIRSQSGWGNIETIDLNARE
ncbi:MAG: hypothetical protein M1281_16240 [Chloroflexi bacterium]|nr:hypothetical protein [Chloroflexota bacterium]